MIPQALSRAAADKRLSRLDQYRVLTKLHEWLDWSEARPVKLTALARSTGVHKSEVSRALVVLVSFGYLSRGPNDGRLHTYRLANPPMVGAGTTSKAA